MKLKTIHANAIVFVTGVSIFGLAACMHGERQAAVAPEPALTPYAYGLYYMDEGPSAKLAYGAPNSDDVSLMMQCAKGSHVVELSDVARDGTEPSLVIASGGKSARLLAAPSTGDGAALLVAKTKTNVAPLQAFWHSGRIDVAYFGARYVIVASAAERVGVERFFAACDGVAGDRTTVAASRSR